MYWFDEQKIIQYAYYKTPKDIDRERNAVSWFQREIFLYQVFHPMILSDFEDGRRNKLSLDECRYLYNLAMDLIYAQAVDEERAWLSVYSQHWDIKKRLLGEEMARFGISHYWKDNELFIEQSRSQIDKLGFQIRPNVSMRNFSMVEIQITREVKSNKFLIHDHNVDIISNEFFNQIQDLATAVREANGIMKRIDQKFKEIIKDKGLTPVS